MNNLFGNLPTVTKNLLIINIICFIGSMIFKQATTFFGVFYPDSPFFKIWQVITYMFMHGSFAHIFFNMFALVMFGGVIERILGPKKYLNYYLISGLGALVLQYGIQAIEVYNIAGTVRASQFLNFNFTSGMVSTNLPISKDQLDTLLSIYGTPLVGASGAIYGLLLAYGYLFPNAEIMLIFLPIPIKAKYFIPILIVIEIFLGFSNSGGSIAHLAHVGGALFGFILLKIWGIRRTNYY
ncbi:rhomboid family intramembrane serine protease [Sphingobacterium mizutaii NBRC 14946 = DSM 11724]|uniref:Rhomboid protease glpG n=2 Tax=Sphingobacterium mizutaii TaxID=1010 RepID=A0AAJ4XG24_9SPHI|nr:rhomboid family intramembrane serine protease [Sphingobacterium mizutaii]GEM69942.1 rhomboid family intramembrane serine protease [Sphingobacterium mizutaii NBRC 14946 = DSM 11724]SDL87428.1 rhomboid-like protein [Sphingobacterium mizutaii]SNV58585.1 Rhomboid protease glpG [Sphingobacterium mizutaii]